MSNILCSICHRQESKYKCPACGAKTCSLECVKRHKKQTECTGEVDTTRFVTRDELRDDITHLNRDYNFLTRVGRDIQVMKNDILGDKKHLPKRSLQGNSGPQVKRYQNQASMNADPRAQYARKLYNDAPMLTKRQNTLVISAPPVLERSRTNKSGYDKKEGQFKWTVEWIFLNSTGESIRRICSNRCGELMHLKDIVPVRALQEFKDTNSLSDELLVFYLHDVLNKTRSTYIQLDAGMTLTDVLKDKVVLEYPTIYVTFSGTELKGEVTLGDKAYAFASIGEQDHNNNNSGSSSESESDSEGESESDSESEEEDSSVDSDDESESDSNAHLESETKVDSTINNDTTTPQEIKEGTKAEIHSKNKFTTSLNEYPDSESDSDEAPQESLSKVPVV